MSIKKIMVPLLLCLTMAGAFSAQTVFAEGESSFEPIESVQLKKYLVMENDVSLPSLTFTYTLSPGDAVEGDASHHQILAGPDGAVFTSSGGVTADGANGQMNFSSSDAATPESSAPAGSDIAFATSDDTSDEQYIEKTLSIDLSGVTFHAPGIYRYVVTEQSSDDPRIVPDANSNRYIDVYVFQIAEDTFAPCAAIVRSDAGTTDAEGNVSSAVKSTGFTNRYQFLTHSLTLSKTVSGNQASNNQYFKFTVTLTGGDQTADGANRVLVSGTFDKQPAENMATEYSAVEMAQANNTDIHSEDGTYYVTLSELRAGKDIYLHAGQEIVLSGIPHGAGYQITEAQEGGYTASATVTGDPVEEIAERTVTDDSFEDDADVVYLNERSGILPSTGISAELVLPVIVMLVGIAAVVVIRRRQKRV